jgi:beta-galactosidase
MNFEQLLYGADYNPEQWRNVPGIWDEDLRLMDLAHINSATIGIFSWVSLEPKEEEYDFSWLDEIVDKLIQSGKSIIMATPSGAKPAWLAQTYPEVRRRNREGLREPQQGRHNHCPSSPIYRQKVAKVNQLLASRYGSLDQLVLWHLSNEYSGYCYCELCFDAFRLWLIDRYGTLDAVNAAWWTTFWSHTFTEWNQIESIGDNIHGMTLDWRRFMTDQCVSFMAAEIAAVRGAAPDARFTTNMMGTAPELNYWKLAPHLDIISWDSYPGWHGSYSPWQRPRTDERVASLTGFQHDLNRSLKHGRPWLLMETTPSATNWGDVSRPRLPGVNRLNGMQAVAHGADGVCYFQWRKSRGSCEKFHGAVVDHVGHENTRVFREVAKLGDDLSRLAAVCGTTVEAEVALIFDWENRWAIEAAAGPRNSNKEYVDTVESYYYPFWKRGVPVDVIESICDLTPYKVVVAPMLYMLRHGVAAAIDAYVAGGGTFVTTYLSGIANESDLCFLGGFPGPLRSVLGIWAEELDILSDNDVQSLVPVEGIAEGLSGSYSARHYCDIVRPDKAVPIASYVNQYYAGTPAVTHNSYGTGSAYYIASRNDERFTSDLMNAVCARAGVKPGTDIELPPGVSMHIRIGDGKKFLFLLNFRPEPVDVAIPADWKAEIDSDLHDGRVRLASYGASVLRTVCPTLD